MTKRFWLSFVVIFVLSMLLDFVHHGLILHGDYLRLPSLFRSDAEGQKYMGWMLLAHAFLTYAFVWIYLRGRETKPWFGQGLRYGFMIAVLAVVPTYLIYYAVQPMPGLLLAKQIFFDTVRTLILGVVMAGMNK